MNPKLKKVYDELPHLEEALAEVRAATAALVDRVAKAQDAVRFNKSEEELLKRMIDSMKTTLFPDP